MLRWATLGIAALASIVASTAIGDQTRIPSYAAAKKPAYEIYAGVPFWQSTDIYCGIRFKVDPAHPVRPTNWLSLEHAYPADWMAEYLGCNNREECRQHPDPTTRARFNHAEGDLHNLWPALVNLNSARGDKPFRELEGSETREVDVNGRIFDCEFQSTPQFVEPRRIVRGNLARSIFYMCAEYGFPVDDELLAVLKKWNDDDPPTKAERTRAERIRAKQGTRNRFIENPSLAAALGCAGR